MENENSNLPPAANDGNVLVMPSFEGKKQKHKWRLQKRWVYMTIAKCVHCGCMRQKIGVNGIAYLYDPFGKKTTVEPQCLLSNEA